jgi:hypothetical protein
MKDRGEMVKTTLRLPRAIWLAARTRALEDGIDFQDMVAAALEQYLKTSRRKEARS